MIMLVIRISLFLQMNVTYVSALYDIYPDRKDTHDRLIRDIGFLLELRIKIILFVDSTYHKLLENIKGFKASVKIIMVPLKELYTYNMIMENRNHIRLPKEKNYDKDKHEYLSLMNTKAELVMRASSHSETDNLCWLDAGMVKMVRDKDKVGLILETLSVNPKGRILAPGCYLRNIGFNDLCNNVWWVFSGTAFIIPKDLVETFFRINLVYVSRFLIKGVNVWEVNVWAEIIKDHPDLWYWYYGNHDDSLLSIPEEYRQ